MAEKRVVWWDNYWVVTMAVQWVVYSVYWWVVSTVFLRVDLRADLSVE